MRPGTSSSKSPSSEAAARLAARPARQRAAPPLAESAARPAAQPRLDDALLARARRSLARRDPRLGAVIRRVGPCDLEPSGDPYRALIHSVVYQQLAGSAAGAILRRVCARFGGRIPRPDRLLAASDEELRADGLSRQKIAAIRAVAGAFADRTLCNRRLARMPDAEVVDAVTQVRGVGEWTAHMLLMFSLGRPDVLPTGDYGVRKGAQILYELDELPKPAELERLGERWRPYRSVGAWYLWAVVDQ
jgi:DNA-3-methyladenine glycosylase II